jgi:hypothetical protein
MPAQPTLSPRCADTGCPNSPLCARYIDIVHESCAGAVFPSLFPFDAPLDDPCPWLLEREREAD